MKKLLFTALMALSAFSVNAQFNYTFSKSTAAYVPLTSGTSVNGTTIWDDERYKIPMGFNFDMHGIIMDSAGLVEMNFVGTDTVDTMNAFLVFTADLVDRGADTSTMSHSPIRYQVTGATPNRIFKLEVANAGFYDEYFSYNTANDSVNYQVWLYETSNIVEIRYGASYIAHPQDYFYNDSLVYNVGLLSQFDYDNTALGMFYFLKGDTSNLTVDSTNDVMNPLNEGASSWPSNGTVYRFTPPTLSVQTAMAALKQVSVYPTAAQQELFIENGSNEKIAYTIISMNGSAAKMNGTAVTGKNTVNISDLPAGMYTIQLSNGQIARAVKFTKL